MIKLDFIEEFNIDNKNIVLFTSDESLAFEGLTPEQNEKLQNLIQASQFKAELHDCLTFYLPFDTIHSITLVGVGQEDLSIIDSREIGGSVAQHLLKSKINEITCDTTKIRDLEHLYAFATGLAMGNYVFDHHKSNAKDLGIPLEAATLITPHAKQAQTDYINEWQHVCSSIYLTRDLTNEPANLLRPTDYVERIKQLEADGLKIKVHNTKDLEKMGAGGILAVGQGSSDDSYLVEIIWQGDSSSKDYPYGFVGKGVTFDTGGLSLKPAKGMDEMKGDMGGSATIVGLMQVVARSKMPVNCVGVLAIVENMVSENAFRPSDVLHTLSGQTIEVEDTDAEGRIILSDALTYCQREYKPNKLIDIATLTGAIVVSLGFEFTGLFTNSDDFAKELNDLSHETGEKLWRMPLHEDIDKLMDSDIADMKNLGPYPAASASKAAHFLQRFVEDDTDWAHLDIAGSYFFIDTNTPVASYGATGWGIILLSQLCKKYCQENGKLA